MNEIGYRKSLGHVYPQCTCDLDVDPREYNTGQTDRLRLYGGSNHSNHSATVVLSVCRG
jgi:hypothetical protein